MELPVPVWDLSLAGPVMSLEFIADVEECITKQPPTRLPLELRVPSWSADETRGTSNFAIKLLEEEERMARPETPQKLPMVLPLFPWNVNLRFCAVSGLLEPWSDSILPSSRDLASPVLTSQPNTGSSMMPSPKKPLAPLTPSQLPCAAEIPPSLGSSSEYDTPWAPQLPTFGGIDMPQTATANQPPAFFESYQPTTLMQNSLPPPPRYDMQTAPHLVTTLESTAQPSYETIASSVTQETRSVPAESSIHPASPTKRPRHTSAEKLRSNAPEVSRLPPIPPLIPIAKESGKRSATINGVAYSQVSSNSSCSNQDFAEGGLLQSPVKPVKASTQSRALSGIGSVEKQVFQSTSIVQSEVCKAIGSILRQVPPEDDSVLDEALRDCSAALSPSQVVPGIRTTVQDSDSIQDKGFHDVELVQDHSTNAIPLPPFVSTFPSYPLSAPLDITRTTTESQVVSNPRPRREQAPVSTPIAPDAVPLGSFRKPYAAVSPRNLSCKRRGLEKSSPHRRLESSSSKQSNCPVTELRQDPSSPPYLASTSISSSLSPTSMFEPGTALRTHEKKRHIPLLPTPTFTSSRPPRSLQSTEHRNITNWKNQQRVSRLPHSSGAPVNATFPTTSSSFANRTARESDGFKMPSDASSDRADSSVLKKMRMASRNETCW